MAAASALEAHAWIMASVNPSKMAVLVCKTRMIQLHLVVLLS